MNLCIDIGNTFTKIGVFQGPDMLRFYKYPSLTTAGIYVIRKDFPGIQKAILSSVSSADTQAMLILESEFRYFIELNHQTPIPLTNTYQTRETLGKDRLAAAVGANSVFPNQHVLVIDAGTAITYEHVSQRNEYLGGNISPGMTMRFRSLHEFTNKLPLIEHEEPRDFMGQSTKEALLAGVVNGITFEMNGYIDMISQDHPDLKVMMTGGDAVLFEKRLKNTIFVDLNLTLKGLNCILDYNAQKK
jgi:type III pantothenate kinase